MFGMMPNQAMSGDSNEEQLCYGGVALRVIVALRMSSTALASRLARRRARLERTTTCPRSGKGRTGPSAFSLPGSGPESGSATQE